jgi:cystathionine beta-lyase/cystathionine gamma-synthase
MAATACAMLALLQPGDHLLASAWIYGGTRQLFCEEFARMGVSVTLVDPSKARGWRTALRKETRAIFVESPVNPTCRVVDLAPISQLARRHGIALVVDSTFASPIGFRALEHGADVVINSTTKFLNGHHDALGGAVSGTASYVEEVRRKMVVWGPAPDPFACWLLERGIKTLALRVERGTANAGRIAAFCAAHPPCAACTTPASPTTRTTRSPRARCAASARCSRSSSRAAGTRHGVPRPAAARHARRVARRRGHARERAALHLARAPHRRRSAPRRGCRTASSDSAWGSSRPTT